MKKIFTKKMAIAIATVLFGSSAAFATVNIEANGTYTQNFDGIGTEATATLPTGWKADKDASERKVNTYGGAAAVTQTERTGGNALSTTASNGIYNFGAGVHNTATDRAVGGLSSTSASKTVNFYLKLTNNGSTPITSFTISYDVEKYRMGSRTEPFRFQLYSSDDDITYTSAGEDFYTEFAGDATSNGYTSAPGDSKSVINKTLTLDEPLAAGNSYYLAWSYSVSTGSFTSNAQALGIDNISITANGATSVSEAIENTIITAGEKAINVQATEGSKIEVYTISGQKIASAVASGSIDTIAVKAKGVIIVNVNGQSTKVVL